MPKSDSQENERLPGWEEEEGSDDSMDERILIQVKEADENLHPSEEGEPES